MALTRTLLLLLVFCCFSASQAVKGSGRGFFGAVRNSTENSTETSATEVVVGSAASKVLKSSLTTVFFPIVYIIVFVVGLPANVMAIWVFLFRTQKKHPSSIYMANLALADLFFVIWMPLKISYHLNGNNWTYGEPLCKVLVSFFYANMYCSVLFITCLSVQRYWVVAHPLSTQKKNSKVAIGISVGIWAFIWLTTTPLYLYGHTAKVHELNITTCHDVNIIADLQNPFPSVQIPFYYFTSMAVVGFFVPCIVIVVAYVLLLRTLGNTMENSTAAKNRNKAVVLIVIVLVTFLVCFIPSNIMLVVHYSLLRNSKGTLDISDSSYSFYISMLCLTSLNSCLDPFIYYFVSEEFRNHVTNTLLCRSNRTVQRMRASFSPMKYSNQSKAYLSESSNTQTSTA